MDEDGSDQGKPSKVDDPFSVFQLTQEDEEEELANVDPKDKKQKRIDFYAPVGNHYDKYPGHWQIDRVPYMWDFGFLLCKQGAWLAAASRQVVFDYTKIDYTNKENSRSVKDIWDDLRRIDGNKDTKTARDRKTTSNVTWREFLQACIIVARTQAQQKAELVYPFDVDMSVTETLSCLFLEVWASEIAKQNSFFDMHNIFPHYREDKTRSGLIDLLKNVPYRQALYKTWLLLGEVFSPMQFESDGLVFTTRPVQPTAISARHWYSTATLATKNSDPLDPLVPVGLPGSYSVRGDWFLAVAKGSRSPLLADRAMDLLSSRLSNMTRLQYGLGLPTRITLKEHGMVITGHRSLTGKNQGNFMIQ